MVVDQSVQVAGDHVILGVDQIAEAVSVEEVDRDEERGPPVAVTECLCGRDAMGKQRSRAQNVLGVGAVGAPGAIYCAFEQ